MNKPIHPAVAEHVMEENERLRTLLSDVIACQSAHYGDGCGLHLSMITLAGRIKASLSQQAEPACACPSGDGSLKWPCPAHARAEPAPAQDERAESKLAAAGVFKGADGLRGLLSAQEFWGEQPYGTRLYFGAGVTDYLHRDVLRAAVQLLDATRPAQTEQQPVEVMLFQLKHPDTGDAHTVALTRSDIADGMDDSLFEKLGDLICDCQPVGETNVVDCNCDDYIYEFELVNAAPIAQTAPQPEQIKAFEALQHAVAYLGRSPMEAIHSGSALHKLMVAALSAKGGE